MSLDEDIDVTKPDTASDDGADSVIKIIVDGKKFETTRATLTTLEPESYFHGMLNEKLGAKRKDGYYWIDRNAEFFHLILFWLRNGDLPDELDYSTLYMLLAEAKFYCLSNLVENLTVRLRLQKEKEEKKQKAIEISQKPTSYRYITITSDLERLPLDKLVKAKKKRLRLDANYINTSNISHLILNYI
jgi:hypothetical protein